MNHLDEIAREHYAKIAKIKVLVLDVDGTLTDGKMFYMGKEQGWTSSFDVKDGLGIKLLMQRNIGIALISAAPRRESVLERCKMLGIRHVYFDCQDKVSAFGALQECYQGLEPSAFAYMGDDLVDLPLLRKVGFSSCPSDAVQSVQQSVHFVSSKTGGCGAVRELSDLILLAQQLG